MIRKIRDIIEARPVEDGFVMGTAVLIILAVQLPFWAALMGAFK